MPPVLCTEKTGFHRVHRTLASIGPNAVKTLASVFDRMLGHLVIGRCWGASGPADVAAHSEEGD